MDIAVSITVPLHECFVGVSIILSPLSVILVLRIPLKYYVSYGLVSVQTSTTFGIALCCRAGAVVVIERGLIRMG